MQAYEYLYLPSPLLILRLRSGQAKEGKDGAPSFQDNPLNPPYQGDCLDPPP